MVFSHLNFKLIKFENKRIIKKTIIFFIKSIIVELVRIFIGNCEQMLPATWYNRVIEKYDNNSHSNILLNVELNIANNVKNTHKNDNGKSLKQKVIFLVLDLSTENFFVNFFSKKSYNKRTRFVET